MELGIDLRYLAHIIESEPLEINNWFGLDIAFFDIIFAFTFNLSAAFVETQASYSTDST